MKNIKKVLITILLFIPLIVGATEVEQIDIVEDNDNQEEVFNKADYQVDETLNTEGNFLGSVYYVGNNITSNSVSQGIGFLAGNNVNIGGIKDYVISAGNNVIVEGEVINDVIIAGNTVRITGKIGRDVIIAGSSVIISGEISRDAKIVASEVTIKGTIKGNLDLSASIINIEEGTTIEGYLNYNDNALIEKSDNIVIKEIKTYTTDSNEDISVTIKNSIYDLLNNYINLLIVALVMTYLLPNIFITLKDKYSNLKLDNYVKLFGKGFLFLIGIPFLALVLLWSSVAFNLSFIFIALYIILLYITVILTGYIVGNILLTKVFKKDENKYFALLLGIAVIKLLELVPFIGSLVSIISLFIGLGIIVENVLIKKR